MRISAATLGALLLVSAPLLVAPPAAAQGSGTNQGTAAATEAAADSAAGSIVGFVIDSIAGRPLGAATVQLALRDRPEISFTTVTDRTGAFRFAEVPTGQYLAGFFHPRLDSLGLSAPTYVVTVGEGETPLVLALPSPATLVAASCGAAASDSSGLFFGRVLDADTRTALRGASVSVSWPEIVLDERGMRQERRQLATTVTDDGRFAICGIPTDGEVVARAELGGDATGTIAIRVPPRGLLNRELLVGRGGAAVAVAAPDSLAGETAATAGGVLGGAPRQGTARLAGVVRGRDGEPFDNARVVLYGTVAADTTDSDGRFALDALPAGTHTLEVRAIGYSPARVAVDLSSGQTDTTVVTMAERVATLDAVTVYGKERTRGRLTEFLDRQRAGFGRFLTAADIQKRNAFDTSDLFRTMPGVRVAYNGSSGGTLVMRGGRNECLPTVFLDGIRLFEGASDLSSLVQPHQIAGIEVYSHASSVPPQFNSGGCGAIVVWTKGAF